MRLVAIGFVLAFNPAYAQVVVDQPLKFGEEICPGYDTNSGAAHGGPRSPYATPPFANFAKSNRKDISSFGVIDEKRTATTVREQKGKIIVISFWSPFCQGSLTQLNELMILQSRHQWEDLLYWPVFPGKMGLLSLQSYMKKDRDKYPKSKLYTLGVGEHGLHAITDELPAVPMTYIVDRNGCIATSYAGYREGRLVPELLKIYNEK